MQSFFQKAIILAALGMATAAPLALPQGGSSGSGMSGGSSSGGGGGFPGSEFAQLGSQVGMQFAQAGLEQA
ncbi:hypothetical protein TI39_contig531g00025 [Zymoseptoria brevis]|uniref:Uncharacterized protein n=1 Tax=Zymoseptoria brevis TaxID=1047168 RepID=A0A0F4GJF0_9PEZI|nr:hypothetical protein TI39_contig531g00025 [Zymoseptoria brevis]